MEPFIPDDWYRQSFGWAYPIIYTHRTVEAAEPEALFAAQQLRLAGSMRVLDLGCGNGRHMVHLQPFAREVVGLDFSADLLDLAAQLLKEHARLVRGDMRQIPFGAAFDGVTNFFTTFGYFPTDEENLSMIREIARVLKPNGRWFIDYLNPDHVARTLIPETQRQQGDLHIRETRWIDRQNQRVKKTTEVTDGKISLGKWGESVRLYQEDELRDLLLEGGLAVEVVFGNYMGEPVGADKPRLILVGHKR